MACGALALVLYNTIAIPFPSNLCLKTGKVTKMFVHESYLTLPHINIFGGLFQAALFIFDMDSPQKVL